MEYILSNKIILYTSFLLTKSEMGGGSIYSINSIIGFTLHPNIYEYTNSLVNTKLFCYLLREVTL